MNAFALRFVIAAAALLPSVACSSSDTSAPAGGDAGGASASVGGSTAATGGSGSAGKGVGGMAGSTAALGGAGGAGGATAGPGGASAGGTVGTAGGGTAGTTSGGGMTGAPEPAPLTGITAAHNAARAAVVPAASPPIPPLTWSPTVAATAQAWADNCVFKHSGGKYGENIYATSGTATGDDVVGSWVSEVADYDYATNSCKKVCGHYTQVVWRDSKNLGCGATTCTKNSPFGGGAWQFWVCNYDPPGNYNGQKPY